MRLREVIRATSAHRTLRILCCGAKLGIAPKTPLIDDGDLTHISIRRKA